MNTRSCIGLLVSALLLSMAMEISGCAGPAQAVARALEAGHG